jgi:4'-phosphopantetheinyl transferase
MQQFSTNLKLKDNEVDIWQIGLRPEPSSLRTLLEILSADERQRASRFHFDRDREKFIVARAALRDILSRYLDISPNQTRFSINRFGKPSLAAELNPNVIQFNISRSNEIALCAVTRGREVGIDIEFINDESANLEIAERFFAPDEIADLKRLPAKLRNAAFFSCWTRKEAYVKAVGEGLSHPLDKFSVSILPEELTPTLRTDTSDQTQNRFLKTLFPDLNYAAALAVEGVMPTIHCRQWLKD